MVRNTTEAINLLAATLPPGARVLCFATEHHANLLPWRRHDVLVLEPPRERDAVAAAADDALRAAGGTVTLVAVAVAVACASNVTGELWPIAELAQVAHRHGAELLVDAAQLAPHRRIDMARDGIDHLALSGHKLYAPYGAGALVARRDRLVGAEPLLAGGGAVADVTDAGVVWAPPPARHEAGTPNLLGAIALGVACDALAGAGLDALAAREDALADALRAGLAQLPGVRALALWEGMGDTTPTISFVAEGRSPLELAAALGRDHAIGVRAGRFCAHPVLRRLTGA
jgi:selenocysteine lyase/cysteine desulfurase